MTNGVFVLRLKNRPVFDFQTVVVFHVRVYIEEIKRSWSGFFNVNFKRVLVLRVSFTVLSWEIVPELIFFFILCD